MATTLETIPAQVRASEGPVPRAFDDFWKSLEARHAWRIVETAVCNRPIAVARLPYAWQDYDNRHAQAFREKHRLEELVAGAADDWDAILRLRQWAFMSIRDGMPSWPLEGHQVTELLDASLAGATFYCTYFAYALVGAAGALGIPARHLGVDRHRAPHEPGQHHGVADVWVNRFRKWVHLDPKYNHHYELDGVPLNAEELGQAWRRNKGAGIQGFIGPERRPVARARAGVQGQHESSCFFWHYIDAYNDVFNRSGRKWPDPVVFLVDEERKRNVWLQGSPGTPHGRYANGSFLTTERVADAYPDLNCTHLELGLASSAPFVARVAFGDTCVPNFSHYVAQVDRGAAARVHGCEFPWRLHPGSNALEIRAVNLGGWQGPPSRIELRIEERTDRTPEWPHASADSRSP